MQSRNKTLSHGARKNSRSAASMTLKHFTAEFMGSI